VDRHGESRLGSIAMRPSASAAAASTAATQDRVLIYAVKRLRELARLMETGHVEKPDSRRSLRASGLCFKALKRDSRKSGWGRSYPFRVRYSGL
jgi:hypothetical protein